MDMIVDSIRWLLWLLCKAAFFLMDSIYSMIKTVIAFDIGNESGLWQWWEGICVFLVFFIFIRIIALFLKSYMDENHAVKNNPVSVIFKIGCICIVILFTPTIVSYFTSIGSIAVEKFDQIFISGETIDAKVPTTGNAEVDKEIAELYASYEGMPSKMFMDGISQGKYPIYTMININETEAGGLDHWFDGVPILGGVFNITSSLLGADGDYVFLPDTTMIVFLLIEALVAAYLFFMMGIQIAQRIFSIGMKVLISPIPISGLINPDDQSFGMWAKLITGDLLTNFFQFMLMKFVLMIVSSPSVINMGITTQPVLFLGGMLCVLVGPGAIAQIIGGDGMGINNTLQAMQSMRTMAHTGKTIASYATGGIAFAGAAGTYGLGRALGGESLSGGNENFSYGRGMPQRVQNGDGGVPGMGSDIPPKAFQESPTQKQYDAAKSRGIDIDGMSKGEASLALEKAGMNKSYWSGKDNFGNFDGGANGTISDKGMDNYSSENAGTDESKQEEPRMTREGSFARRFADRANESSEENNRPGLRNVAAIGASSLYQASATRLFGQRTVMRRGQYIQRNTRPQSMANFAHSLRNSVKKEKDPMDPKVIQEGVEDNELL